MKSVLAFIIFFTFALIVNAKASGVDSTAVDDSTISFDKCQQLILWTSGDREVALKMVFMYAYNCKKYSWMDNVRLLVWGPSGKLLVEDAELQEQLTELKEIGVELYACKACADLYGISDKLEKFGITVMYTGKMLAELQKAGWFILTI
jgi:hypothetical protein